MHLRSLGASVLVFALAAAGCGSAAEATDIGETGACVATTEAPAVTVVIAGRAFDPGRVQGIVGQPIGWENRDAVPHTATLDEGDCTTQNLGRGDIGGLVFSSPGTYPYHCRIHSDMTGTIEITG